MLNDSRQGKRRNSARKCDPDKGAGLQGTKPMSQDPVYRKKSTPDNDFRSWIKFLENEGLLSVITVPVRAQFEIGAITKKLDGVKGVFFKNVEGYSVPVISNLCFSREIIARYLGVESDQIITHYLEAMAHPRPCPVINDAPFKDHILTQDLNLHHHFPIPTYHEEDAGPYVTGGVVITKDPETGIRNASIHRLQIFEDGEIGILMLPRHLDLCYHKAKRMGRPLEVAVAIGVEPITLLASQTILPFGVDELEVANSLHPKGQFQLSRCATVDVEVPADSEIVLEGTISLTDERPEGPFGEFPKYYSPKANRPILRLKAICHRIHPIFYTILPASREHLLLGAIPREASLLKFIRSCVPSIRQVHLTFGGTCRYHLVISVEKKNEGEARNAILAAMANNADVKHVVAVDQDVDIFNMEEVEWAIATRCQSDKDIFIIPDSLGSKLDPSTREGVGAKMGIDATVPLGKLSGRFKPIRIPGFEELNFEDFIP